MALKKIDDAHRGLCGKQCRSVLQRDRSSNSVIGGRHKFAWALGLAFLGMFATKHEARAVQDWRTTAEFLEPSRTSQATGQRSNAPAVDSRTQYPYPGSDRAGSYDSNYAPNSLPSNRPADMRWQSPAGTATARVASRMSVGQDTSTGNLNSNRFDATVQATGQTDARSVAATQRSSARTSDPRFTSTSTADQFAGNSRLDPTLARRPLTGNRAPVVQQTGSTLSGRSRKFETADTRSNQAGFSQTSFNQAIPNQSQAQAQLAARVAQAPAGGVATGATTAYQIPALGFRNRGVRTAQNCNCQPTYNAGYAQGYAQAAQQTGQAGGQAAAQAPALNPNVGSGLAVPPLNIQVPGQSFAQAPNQFSNPQLGFNSNLGTPQFGAQGANWWTPFVSGSGVYTPLIKFRNMPPGTYLGQGLIGQPTAYVDGQPIRNLLRYIAP